MSVKRILVITTLLICLPLAISAQPNVAFLHVYDNAQWEMFYDIYTVSDGGYIMCGVTSPELNLPEYSPHESYIVRTDEDGRILWEQVIDEDDPVYALTIIEADNGDFVGGGSNGNQFYAFRITNEGELIWSQNYAQGYCHAVIELKDGTFLLAGIESSGTQDGILVRINGDGEPLWDELYNQGNHSFFYSVKETEGGAIAVGRGIRDHNSHVWVVKASIEDGEEIWSSYFDEIPPQSGSQVVSTDDGGFMVCGSSWNPSGPFLLKFDEEGGLQWYEQFFINETAYFSSLVRTPDGGYAAVGALYIERGLNRPMIVRANRDGASRWQAVYELDVAEQFGTAVNRFYSVTLSEDDEIIACGWVLNEGENSLFDGLIMKLEVDQLGPQVVRYSPQDLDFSVLPGTEVEFIFVAISQNFEELTYSWFSADTLLAGNDTTVTVQFDDIGDHWIECQAEDEDAVISCRWSVHVTDLYVDTYEPDTLDIIVRRGTEVDFSVEVAAVEDENPINYTWTLDDDNVGENSPEWTHVFEVPNIDPNVVAVSAFRGETIDAIAWNVLVRSTVWSWWPQESSFSVALDSTVEFGVWPFNPDSDSLSFLWTLNDEDISTEWDISYSFEDTGRFTVNAYVNDGCEADTLNWNVNVYDPAGVNQRSTPELPTQVELSIPLPNPFNSTASIFYGLPYSSDVTLTLIDYTGRVVQEIATGHHSAGYHAVSVDGSDLPTGLYIARLEAGNAVRYTKLVCVK